MKPSDGAARRARASVWTTGLFSLLLIVAVAPDAAANCQNGATTQSISAGTSGNTVANILAVSTEPCTVNIAPGTYTAGTAYTIADGITVRGTGGPSVTVLQVTQPQFASLLIWPVNGSCPSGATVEGLTIAGGAWGILALADSSQPGCPSNQLSGITLRNLVVFTGQGNGHGIDFHAVQNSVIDSTWVDSAYTNGIILQRASNNNIVMNNTIVGSFSQHAIAPPEQQRQRHRGQHDPRHDGVRRHHSELRGGLGRSRKPPQSHRAEHDLRPQDRRHRADRLQPLQLRRPQRRGVGLLRSGIEHSAEPAGRHRNLGQQFIEWQLPVRQRLVRISRERHRRSRVEEHAARRQHGPRQLPWRNLGCLRPCRCEPVRAGAGGYRRPRQQSFLQ